MERHELTKRRNGTPKATEETGVQGKGDLLSKQRKDTMRKSLALLAACAASAAAFAPVGCVPATGPVSRAPRAPAPVVPARPGAVFLRASLHVREWGRVPEKQATA